MRDCDDPVGRHTRAFWHRFPKDDGWRAVTLASQEVLGHGFEPVCRNCWHHGSEMTASQLAGWAGVPMDTPIIALAARLVCSRCDHPAGYFHLHNPHVKARGTR